MYIKRSANHEPKIKDRRIVATRDWLISLWIRKSFFFLHANLFIRSDLKWGNEGPTVTFVTV